MNEIWPKSEKTQASRPRPGRPVYPPCNLGSSLVRMLMSANTNKSNVVSYKMHKPRPKGLSHNKLGLSAATKLRTKSQTDLRRKIQALIDTLVEWRAEGDNPRPAGLSRAARPLTASLRTKPMQPTSSGNQERPQKGVTKLTEILGRPA